MVVGPLVVLLLGLLAVPALALSGSIVDSGASTDSLYYTGSFGAPSFFYKDAQASQGNADLSLMVCDEGSSKYVGAAYGLNISGSMTAVLISYNDASNPLAAAGTSGGGSCYYAGPMSAITFSPSYLDLATDVYYAAFPGTIWVMYADNADGTANAQYVHVDASDGYLRGSYSGFISTSSFDEGSTDFTISNPTISFTTQSGSFSTTASNADHGVTSDRRMVVGICNDSVGINCCSGQVVDDTSDFSLTLDACVAPNDQETHTRYGVINGIGTSVCIGGNLYVSSSGISEDQDPIYYGQVLNLSYSYSNTGNVNVSTDFLVYISVYDQSNASRVVFEDTIDVTDLITSGGGSDSGSTVWAVNATSGNYVAKVEVDSGSAITECAEGDNDDTTSFEVKAVAIPQVYLNGVATENFSFAGRPYNFTLFLVDSDGLDMGNASVILREVNGVSFFAPTQVWNATINSQSTQTGLVSYSEGRFYTDDDGMASFTVIPGGNKLYTADYAYTDVYSYLGDYSLYLTGTDSSGDDLTFSIGGSLYTEYGLLLGNHTIEAVGGSLNYPNQNSYVDHVMEWVYAIYATFWKVVIA